MLRLVARNTQKYRKYVLIAWLAIALVLVPVAVRIRSQGTASELEFIPETEADRTMRLLQEKFPTIPAATILIVLQAPDVREAWTRQLNDKLLSKIEEGKLYAYEGFTSIFSVETLVNTQINQTIAQVLNLASELLPDFLNQTRYDLLNLRSAINATSQLLYGTVGMLAQTWWNISRITAYMGNLTEAYVIGLNDTHIATVSTVTQADSATIQAVYNLTKELVLGVPLGLIMQNSSLNDQYSFQMAFQAVNQSFTAKLVLDQEALQTLLPLFSKFIQGINNTIEAQLAALHESGETLSGKYYFPSSLSQSEVSTAINSQFIVLEQMLNLTKMAGNTTVSAMIQDLPNETAGLLSQAWSLKANTSISALNNATLDLALSQMKSEELIQTLFGNTTSAGGFSNYLESLSSDLEALLAPLLDPSTDETALQVISDQFVASLATQLYSLPVYFEFPSRIPSDVYRQFVSEDNTTMIFIVAFTESSQETKVQENTPIVRDIVASVIQSMPNANNVTALVSGEAALFYDLQKVSEEDIGKTDMYTVVMVIGVLLLVFLSPVAPFIPLFTIGVAIIAVYSVFYGLSLVTTIPTMMLTLTTVVMMGAGVDYLVFLLYRYKEEREHKKAAVSEAIDNTVVHAGESIITSGLSVAIGFGILMFSSIRLLFWIGLGPLIGVLISLVAALTLIPVLLSYLEDKIFWPRTHIMRAIEKQKQAMQVKKNKKNKNNPSKTKKTETFTHRAARWIVDHPKTVVLVFLVVSSPFVYFGANMQTSYDFAGQIPESQESVRGLQVMSDAFGASEVFPIYALISLPSPLFEKGQINQTLFRGLEELRQKMLQVRNVSDALGITAPNGGPTPINASALDAVAFTELVKYLGSDNATVYFVIKMEVDPLSEEGLRVAENVKAVLKEELATNPALKRSTGGIGGFSPEYVELSNIIQDDTPKLVSLVLIGLFLLLTIALRSVVTPIRLQLTILLGVYISLGITDLVFRQWLGEHISWMLPVTLFVMIFGLGMDYDIFLVTRIREEVKKGKSDKEATIEALTATSGVISAAGIIMATAFASLLFSELIVLRTMGFAIATAVLVDSLLIRLILVPATMVLLEKWNWWLPFTKKT